MDSEVQEGSCCTFETVAGLDPGLCALWQKQFDSLLYPALISYIRPVNDLPTILKGNPPKNCNNLHANMHKFQILHNADLDRTDSAPQHLRIAHPGPIFASDHRVEQLPRMMVHYSQFQ